MQRTQIYLDDEESQLLEDAAARTGASKSELIRRAVRAQYGRRSPEARLEALQVSAGVWKTHATSGVEYVDELRGDLNERMDRLGLS